jgi:uncharacterized protein YcbK (DUF882 family)
MSAMQDEFIHSLDTLRHECGFSFRITSGYRSPSHSIEARKAKPGVHAQGIAADIGTTDGYERYIIVKNAMAMGFSGIGIHKTFVHVDTPRLPHCTSMYRPDSLLRYRS